MQFLSKHTAKQYVAVSRLHTLIIQLQLNVLFVGTKSIHLQELKTYDLFKTIIWYLTFDIL